MCQLQQQKHKGAANPVAWFLGNQTNVVVPIARIQAISRQIAQKGGWRTVVMELHHVTTCSRAKKEGYQEAMGRGFECHPNITYMQ